MSYTIQNLKDDMTPILHGFSTDELSNFYQICRRAGNKVMSRVDLHTTERVVPMTNALYDSIYDYVVPADLKLNKIFDITPQVVRSRFDYNDNVNSRQFDIKRSLNTFTLRTKDGVKTLRINKKLHDPLIVHTCDSNSADGVWAATDDANDITIDNNFYLTGTGALRFDLDGLTGTGTITLSGTSAKNLSTVKDVGALFLWLYFPDQTRITNVNLRWGSSPTDYYSRTVTTPHTETAFSKYWNLLRFDWNGATQTGTPDDTAIDYVRVQITYTTGTVMNALYMENILAIRGVPHDLHYYSSYMFKTAAGVYIDIPTSLTDIINVDNDNYTIFLDEFALIATQSVQAEESAFDSTFFRNELNGITIPGREEIGLYDSYVASFPSKAIIQIDEYYNFGFDESFEQDIDPDWNR